MPNRLAQESSPYLRQHAENPVEWFAYGTDAFAEAARLDRPILLSVGYSACHWCHVMAHESFEDVETAKLMNERFVNIKVDREELPDVDQIYQRALALQGDSGGWPLTMFLTPEGTPFFGGTYFPPAERYGRPSFRRVLVSLSDAWQRDRQSVLSQAQQYKDGLQSVATRELARGATDDLDGRLNAAVDALAGRIDPTHGGFGGAPKFPNASALRLLARSGRRRKDATRTGAFLLTLTKMAEGGIYDQVGGGFSRYSTDATWLVPHFEKMLYDNAQLLVLYAEGHQLTRDPLYARVIRETATWLEREMRAPEGGFYTALDADSDGLEGRFYVWTWTELADVLDDNELERAQRLLGAQIEGNWKDPHGHSPKGANVLHVASQPRDDADAAARDALLKKLFDRRAPRARPGTDDKVLASTNGLAILGLAEAGRVLGDASLVDAARRTATFVLEHMRDADGRLSRAWKGGVARLPGTLDDHAYVADGLIALYEATGEARWFDAAYELVQLAVKLFWDDAQAAFYLTAADEPGMPALIERPLSGYDGAVPAGASVLIERLFVLGEAMGDVQMVTLAERALRARAERALEQPFAYAHLLGALETMLDGSMQIVVTTSSLDRAIARVYLPSRLIVRGDAPAALASLVAGKTAPGAYVCRKQACERPEADPVALEDKLRA